MLSSTTITNNKLSYAREICGSERRRRNLTSQWRGQHFLTQMRIQPNGCIGSYPKSGKREFDVLPSERNYPPCLVWTDGESLLLTPNDNSHLGIFWTEITHTKVLDHQQMAVFRKQGEDKCRLDVIEFKFAIHEYEYDLDARVRFSIVLPSSRPNDFKTSKTSNGSVAVIRAGAQHQKMYFITENSPVINHSCSPHIAASDIIAVESMHDVSSLVFGHQNGQVSLQDLRDTSAGCCSQLLANDNANSGTVDLHPLNQRRPYQVLASSDCGHCRLFDIRTFGSSATQQTGRSSVVHELQNPNQRHGQNHICKGLATDPSQTVAMVPFVDDTKAARLGVWSLDSGIFVGSKKVGTTNANDHVALSPKITQTWNCDSEINAASSMPGSYSLWLSCGSDRKEKNLPSHL